MQKTIMEMKMQVENEKEIGSVFEAGNLSVKTMKVKKSDGCRPPAEVLVVAPEAQGRYPLVLFCHGYCTQTSWYSQLLCHISSHGYILVAPKLYQWLLICKNDEIKTAGNVANWVARGGLETCLPENVKPDLSKTAVMGHSRGGRTAFGLALGHRHLAFKALIGLDPVEGPAPAAWVEPRILSYVPRSFNAGMPVAVVGGGLGNRSKGVFVPPLAPDGCSHAEFFNESRPPCCYFVAKDYGHCDVLDEERAGLGGLVCRSGKGPKEKMRRGVGGVVVAFLRAYLGGECGILEGVVAAPALAPVTMDPVIYVKE
ncbi:chlorophyllase-1-like [Salvia miltiorrhiza]|uniref:chlorophyllase-1-like n=1 Tax=Salvia miltiorrhiza TaxID=226208 RepID=UPI0025AB6A73|nr:chlorophyllase-1-like [Salvia miltiorrhiza]